MNKKIISLGIVFITMLAMGCTGQLQYGGVEAEELIGNTEYYLNRNLETKLYVEYVGSITLKGTGYRLFYGYESENQGSHILVVDPMNFLDDGTLDSIQGIVIMGEMDNETVFFLFATEDSDTAECIVLPTMTKCGGGGDDRDIIIIPIPYDLAS